MRRESATHALRVGHACAAKRLRMHRESAMHAPQVIFFKTVQGVGGGQRRGGGIGGGYRGGAPLYKKMGVRGKCKG